MRNTVRGVIAALALLLGTAATSVAAVNVWQQSLPGTSVYSVATGPRLGAPDQSDLYVGVGVNSPYGAGVLKSTDGGQTWAKVASYTNVYGLSTDFRIPGRVYAATSTGLFRSDDAGATWTASPLKAEIRSSIAVSMIDSNVLYGNNYRSTDGGATWALMTGAPPHYDNGSATRISPANPNVVYSIGSGVAAASSDGGLSWELLRSGTATIYGISDVALHPTSVETRYVSSRYGSWNFRYAPGVTTSFLPGTPILALALDPSAPEKVYAITTGGVKRSLDSGATWASYGGPGSYYVPQAGAAFDDLTGKLHVPGDVYLTTWNSAGLWSVETRGVPTCTDADLDGFFLEGLSCGTAADCNDSNPAIRPNATEICDGIDNDCDGLTDEGVAFTYYRDADGDTYGSNTSWTQACSQPAGYVSRAGDCNDNNPAVNPAAAEICDSIDNNCNGQTDEGLTSTYYRDFDADTYGMIGTGWVQACTQPSGYATRSGDCNDNSAAVSPSAVEVCNDTIDNNCNGQTDCLDAACSGTPACQPPPCTTPGAPGSLAALAAKRAVTLTWLASSPAPTKAYRVYRRVGSTGSFTLRASVGPTTLTYLDSGLTTGTTYWYYVKAWSDCDGDNVVDAGEEGAASNTVSAKAK